MTSTERARRRRDRIRNERDEERRIAETYFGGRPPLSEAERRRLARQWGLE
jgi:hypothetical protein